MSNRRNTRRLTGVAIFTALVIVLQLLGSFIKFGPFSVSLTLIPIVVGAALYGPAAGAWLGLIFGIVVLVSGDASPFLAVSVPGTVFTVLVKGALAGFISGTDPATGQTVVTITNEPAVQRMIWAIFSLFPAAIALLILLLLRLYPIKK